MNGEHTNYKNGDDWGMVYYCYTHINAVLMVVVMESGYGNHPKMGMILLWEPSRNGNDWGMIVSYVLLT